MFYFNCTPMWISDMLWNGAFGSANLAWNRRNTAIDAIIEMNQSSCIWGGGFYSYYDNFDSYCFNSLNKWLEIGKNNMANQAGGGSWWNFGNGSGTKTPSTTNEPKAETPEEIQAKADYKELEKLMKIIADFLKTQGGSSTAATLEALNNLLNKPTGTTWTQRLADLKVYYNKFKNEFMGGATTDADKKAMYDFIFKNIKLGNKLVGDLLKEIGYPDTDSTITKTAQDIRRDIERMKDKSSDKFETVENSVTKETVLQTISEYNTTYSEKKPEKTLMNDIVEAFNTVSGENKMTARGGAEHLINALIEKAQVSVDNIGGETGTNIQTAIDNLKDKIKLFEKSDINDADKTNLVNAFNDLYIMVRMAETKNIERQLSDNYGKIDNTIFSANDGYFVEQTIKDLATEGLQARYDGLKTKVKREAGRGFSNPASSGAAQTGGTNGANNGSNNSGNNVVNNDTSGITILQQEGSIEAAYTLDGKTIYVCKNDVYNPTTNEKVFSAGEYVKDDGANGVILIDNDELNAVLANDNVQPIGSIKTSDGYQVFICTADNTTLGLEAGIYYIFKDGQYEECNNISNEDGLVGLGCFEVDTANSTAETKVYKCKRNSVCGMTFDGLETGKLYTFENDQPKLYTPDEE